MKYIFIAICIMGILGQSCSKKDPIIPNEEELITTLKYTLVPRTGTDSIVLTFKDLDGDGGLPPTATSAILTKNTVYLGTLELFNELSIPGINIGEEIQDEAEAHQFFFLPATGLSCIVTYEDMDATGKPLGLKTTLKTGSTSSGKLKITLRHQPDKSAAGVSGGDVTNAGGETDIEISFDVTIQ